MTFYLGLTGSIGMGKSTTAQMFVEEGCELWDADAAVHRLYSLHGSAVDPIQKLFPDAVVDGAVNRQALKQEISDNPDALKLIESVVHPLVTQDRENFKKTAVSDILVFDIPLLFETGGNTSMDAVVCVTAPAEIQRERVLSRGTMTREQFELIREKQMSDSEKRARSNYVITTDTLENARAQVHTIVEQIRAQQAYAGNRTGH